METKAAIIKYCQYQERCHGEVRNKLYELGCRTPEVEEYLAEMISMGLLNEERFARAFARGKFRLLHWGREKIKQQLKIKKISDYCIKKAMTEIDGEEYEQKLIKLIKNKEKQLNKEKSINIKKQKIYRYIVQKGYERDIVISLLNNIDEMRYDD